jgi:hypothetical protein
VEPQLLDKAMLVGLTQEQHFQLEQAVVVRAQSAQMLLMHQVAQVVMGHLPTLLGLLQQVLVKFHQEQVTLLQVVVVVQIPLELLLLAVLVVEE